MPEFDSVDSVLLVHGYSVRTLDSWGRLPALLQADGIESQSLFLSAFVSLDDYVSCDDLAQACEEQVSLLESKGIDLRRTCVISHSTGSLVARRWILNRRERGAPLPGYFISCAGANHGSSLSQLGRTDLAKIFRGLTEKTSVGKRVLEDLDYGSAFLRRLNRDWLNAWNSQNPLYKEVFCFSMGGADHRFWQNHLTWQGHETGSDGTVRISSANLNYRFINVKPPYSTNLEIETMKQPCPHLVADTPEKHYSHTNQSATDTLGLVMSKVGSVASSIIHTFGGQSESVTSTVYGILEGIQSPDERPYVALHEALAVTDVNAYAALQQKWAAETAAWSAANLDEANATIIFSITDQKGNLADDSIVLIRDKEGTLQNASLSILPNGKIYNKVSPSVISFYVNNSRFEDSHPHNAYVEAQTDTAYVTYDLTVDAPISTNDAVGEPIHVIAQNECTYVDIRVARNAKEAFVFYENAYESLASILGQAYPPFLEGYVK